METEDICIAAFAKKRSRQSDWLVVHGVLFVLLFGGFTGSCLYLSLYPDSMALSPWWLYGAGFGLVVGYFVYLLRRVHQDTQASLRYFQLLVDRRERHPEHQLVPVSRRDEFGDFARYLDNALVTIAYDYQHVSNKFELLQAALAGSLTAKVLLNSKHEVVTQSLGFMNLWEHSRSEISALVGADHHLDCLIGERLDVGDIEHGSVRYIDNIRYELNKLPLLHENEPIGFLLECRQHQNQAEIQALTANINLLAADSWDIPVRLQDKLSPFYPHTVKLESVRRRVKGALEQLSHFFIEHGVVTQKITKLQQLEGLTTANLQPSGIDQAQLEGWQTTHLEQLNEIYRQLGNLASGLDHQSQSVAENTETWTEQMRSSRDQLQFVQHAIEDIKAAIVQWIAPGAVQNPQLVRAHAIDLSHDIDTVIAVVREARSIIDTEMLPGTDGHEIIHDVTELGERILQAEAHVKGLSRLYAHKIENVAIEPWDEF
ncbi:hypothetical protein FJM67_03465 [Maribrevibacterium harenarium]|uniref:Uncharacterized protein n=1 Tax=Maribrevibacterium harenarium TaxID=2589817 RepID=A0A501X2I5_9GAMM|nr:hypothetical protein [Maribrevibacterium harenarium]TPE54701.1 hypothetical protein FJM67_03465 [Maribrevibacterium harenarium]